MRTRLLRTILECLCTVCQIGDKSLFRHSLDTEPATQNVQQGAVVNRVKGGTEIEQYENRDLAVVKCCARVHNILP